jgi:RNA polymerase sigma-70 factor (ECF subfamily)
MVTWQGGRLVPSPAAESGGGSFEAVYRTWYTHVARWARGRGANEADVEDLAQEVFIIVRRKLAHFDGRNLPGFLYRITERTVRDHRRSAWFRNLFRGPQALGPEVGAHEDGTLEAIQRRERREALEAILAKMSEKRRTTFILFEIEGYTGEEIAQIQSLPVDTVWTRLHHARKDFMRLVRDAGCPRTRVGSTPGRARRQARASDTRPRSSGGSLLIQLESAASGSPFSANRRP